MDPVPVDAGSDPAGDDDTAHRDDIELLKTGLTSVWINGRRYRLRRPFFGELKDFRLALEALREQIDEKRDGALQVAEKLEAELKEIDTDEALTPRQRATKIRQIRQKDRVAGRAVTEAVEDLYPGWWTRVFEVLSLDGQPPQLPAWVTDGVFVEKLMAHWRSAPAGPG